MNRLVSLSFEKPAPGAWSFDRSHQREPAPLLMQLPLERSYDAGFRSGFAEIGALLEVNEGRFVHGWFYTCLRPVGAPAEPKGGPPPKLIFKLLLAAHPTMRRRVARAEQIWDERPWLAMAERWRTQELPAWQRRLATARRQDPADMNDDALRQWLSTCIATWTEVSTEHFHRAVSCIVPGGQLMLLAEQSGCISPVEASQLLAGSSPESRRPADQLHAIGAAIRAAGAQALLDGPGDLQARLAALRAADPQVAKLLDAWLDEQGWTCCGGDDLSSRALWEQPELLLAMLRAASRQTDSLPTPDADALARQLAARLPQDARPAFLDAVDQARTCITWREQSVGLLDQALGLVRRAVLELGRRLVAQGRLPDVDAVFHCREEELTTGPLPDAAVLAERIALHQAASKVQPPTHIGDPGAPPPLEWLPPGSQRLTRAVMAYVSRFESAPDLDDPEPLRGLPVSAGAAEGRAFVLTGGRDIAELQPGDVLVAPSTSPALNCIMPSLAAVVTEFGGLVSHTAIVSRELGLPAIVGCVDATTAIPHGAWVRVDGDQGRVTVLAPDAQGRSPVARPQVQDAAALPTPQAPPTPGAWRPLAQVTDAARFGGKAANLATAVRAGHTVPPGVALDTALVEGVAAADPACLAALDQAVATLRFPLAVRSSAPGEDGLGASFAGLHHTQLGVGDRDALHDAIHSVWASAHGAAAQAYRRRLGLSGRPEMAVLLQEMLQPAASGVRFGCDPISGEDVRVLEVAPGLGVAVVDGRVRPDRLRLAPSGEVIERVIGDKPVQVVVGREGVEEVQLSPEQAHAPCLDEAAARAVHDLGEACDRLFAHPQDVEFALAGDTLWLLQSRPVTTGSHA